MSAHHSPYWTDREREQWLAAEEAAVQNRLTAVYDDPAADAGDDTILAERVAAHGGLPDADRDAIAEMIVCERAAMAERLAEWPKVRAGWEPARRVEWIRTWSGRVTGWLVQDRAEKWMLAELGRRNGGLIGDEPALFTRLIAEQRAATEQRARRRQRSADGCATTPDVLPLTRQAIEARRKELKAAGQRHGYGTLAKEFTSTASTIRRRLGKDC